MTHLGDAGYFSSPNGHSSSSTLIKANTFVGELMMHVGLGESPSSCSNYSEPQGHVCFRGIQMEAVPSNRAAVERTRKR